ncbi:phage major capsid protein [Aureimonas phyllosphaerae]|uniref:HK97 family phage major capsid protein n=1 Tax=Aureimonas phyllosphaerae TaxID=1166078 RepID=A0A7W6BQQ9_9HYPH|nr:phage major capsid protein [Aureimonas phyllosphaerae]MBB3934284.1 HK97 family phage major capsid protein [Aureimonas phyllosphaerae]MBB3958500.1 HK97 family phage major capsid protein [Aureimonas phyllosphaerae]SFE98017.1 phage major capsid protein, HK97 family [Aureimonas phyllosphaerae]
MTMHDTRLVAPHREYGRKDAGQQADDQIELRAVMEGLTKRDAEIKAFAEKAGEEIKNTGKIAADTKAALELLVKEGSDLQARMIAVEQKLARRGGGSDAPAAKSNGELLTDSDEFKSMKSRGGGTARINVKAVTSITSATTGTGGVGDAIRPNRLPGITTPAQRVLTIRDLLLPGRTDSSSIEYVKETGFQNMAAPVAELGLKPQSDLAFDLATAQVRTLAHWFYASKQVLDDIPLLQSYIDGRARYGLALVEEAQLLAGDGTGQNILGLIPQATPYAFATYSKSGDTKIDRIRRAILQVRVAQYRASAIVMSPNDWADIELTKDAGQNYIIANPGENGEKRLWGLPVVDSDAIADGKFMVGAFNVAAQVFDREDANVQVSTEDRDNFIRNAVTIRAEERLALVVHRPESFVYGNLTTGNAS